ncbi:MAG: hypothetical protein COB53_00540 [Elusimicrobia bacterium]|nr:MAG: hypothetical protein COB53_00540 [Elusimicrobiota bacterium]
MTLDAQSPVVLLTSTVIGAAAVGFGLRRFGDAEMRSWAVPGAVAILCAGIGYTFYLPSIITIPAFLAALYFLHRDVRQRQEKAVASLTTIEVEGHEIGFQKMRTLPKGLMGLWRESPKMGGAPGAAEQKPIELSLKFVGENEDEYQVLLSAQVAPFISGVLFIHHEDCDKKFRTTLTDQSALTGLEGQPANLIFKAIPADYVFGVLDIAMVARISELFELRGGEREIVLHASGAEVRLISNRLLEEDELRLAFSRIALIADKIRMLGGQERLY